MANNSISFGSTHILHTGNQIRLDRYTDALMSYKNRSFWNVRSFRTIKDAQKKMAPGEIAVVLDKDAMNFVGRDNIDDKLIYKILKKFCKDKNIDIKYVNDSVNIIG